MYKLLMFVIICCCHLQVLPVNDLIGLSWCMDGEGECVLDLTGICAGSLLRECLRQGQSFAPPGDAAEAERGCPRAGCSHIGGCSWSSFFPPPLQLPYPTTDFFFSPWLFMGRVRRKSGRRMAQRLWHTSGVDVAQDLEFWDLESDLCWRDIDPTG